MKKAGTGMDGIEQVSPGRGETQSAVSQSVHDTLLVFFNRRPTRKLVEMGFSGHAYGVVIDSEMRADQYENGIR